jgi:hypothetical protein
MGSSLGRLAKTRGTVIAVAMTMTPTMDKARMVDFFMGSLYRPLSWRGRFFLFPSSFLKRKVGLKTHLISTN